MVLPLSSLLMNKIPSESQNTEAKTLPVDVCIFDCFGQLSPAAVHSADSCSSYLAFSPGISLESEWCKHIVVLT